MKMTQMGTGVFLSYINDERKDKTAKGRLNVFYHIPDDCRGAKSTFIFMVLHDRRTGSVYCAGAKRNPYEDKFDFTTGIKLVANRLWREFKGGKSLYGKNHTKPVKKLMPSVFPGAFSRLMAMNIMFGNTHALPSPFKKGFDKTVRKMLSPAGKDTHATKKA